MALAVNKMGGIALVTQHVIKTCQQRQILWYIITTGRGILTNQQ